MYFQYRIVYLLQAFTLRLAFIFLVHLEVTSGGDTWFDLFAENDQFDHPCPYGVGEYPSPKFLDRWYTCTKVEDQVVFQNEKSCPPGMCYRPTTRSKCTSCPPICLTQEKNPEYFCDPGQGRNPQFVRSDPTRFFYCEKFNGTFTFYSSTRCPFGQCFTGNKRYPCVDRGQYCNTHYSVRVPNFTPRVKNDQCGSQTIQYTFDINYMSGSPDGVHKHSILGINGKFPGPTIEGTIGDVLEVEIINNIRDGQNTTLHWHGLLQKGTPFEDGPSQITQCPLINGKSQVYRFNLAQTGTFWYHSHVGSQYTEGLWGALIIKDKVDVYAYDAEFIITLTDWYHNSAQENERWYLSPESGGVPPYPDSILMNGLGRYPCNVTDLEETWCCNLGVQNRPVFKITPKKSYRIRLINASGLGAFNFSIDGHKLETIEVDGIDVYRPVKSDAVFIGFESVSFLSLRNEKYNVTILFFDTGFDLLVNI